MYTVVLHDQTTEFDERRDAIEAAKELSRGCRNRVEVVAEDQKELFVYHDGQLAQYIYETRRGKSVPLLAVV